MFYSYDIMSNSLCNDYALVLCCSVIKGRSSCWYQEDKHGIGREDHSVQVQFLKPQHIMKYFVVTF